MKEVRVYAVNIHEIGEDAKDSIDVVGWDTFPDWEFIEMAEKQGNVWTLSGFQKAFNYEEVNTDMFYIRIIDK